MEQCGRVGDEVSPAALLQLSARVHEKALKEYNDLARHIRIKKSELRVLKKQLRRLGQEVEWAERRRWDLEQDPLPGW